MTKNLKSIKASKILKMEEKNEHGQAMTKPLPTGCIEKKNLFPTDVNLIL